MSQTTPRKPSLIPNIRHAIDRYIPVIEEKLRHEKRGGWFCIMEKSRLQWSVILHDCTGVIPKDKDTKYHRLSYEKAQRLSMNPQHRTSYMSRNERFSQWGGAIRTFSNPEYIFSFSGFPEIWDEALMLAATCDLNLMNAQQAYLIATPEAFDAFMELHLPIQAS